MKTATIAAARNNSALNALRVNLDWAKLPLFERKGWKRLPFGEFAQSVNERVEPSAGISPAFTMVIARVAAKPILHVIDHVLRSLEPAGRRHRAATNFRLMSMEAMICAHLPVV